MAELAANPQPHTLKTSQAPKLWWGSFCSLLAGAACVMAAGHVIRTLNYHIQMDHLVTVHIERDLCWKIYVDYTVIMLPRVFGNASRFFNLVLFLTSQSPYLFFIQVTHTFLINHLACEIHNLKSDGSLAQIWLNRAFYFPSLHICFNQSCSSRRGFVRTWLDTR